MDIHFAITFGDAVKAAATDTPLDTLGNAFTNFSPIVNVIISCISLLSTLGLGGFAVVTLRKTYHEKHLFANFGFHARISAYCNQMKNMMRELYENRHYTDSEDVVSETEEGRMVISYCKQIASGAEEFMKLFSTADDQFISHNQFAEWSKCIVKLITQLTTCKVLSEYPSTEEAQRIRKSKIEVRKDFRKDLEANLDKIINLIQNQQKRTLAKMAGFWKRKGMNYTAPRSETEAEEK